VPDGLWKRPPAVLWEDVLDEEVDHGSDYKSEADGEGETTDGPSLAEGAGFEIEGIH
jgi:hypothetical protein